MSSFTIILLVILGFGLLILLYLVSIYNNLVSNKNRFKNAFSQIDVQLKRRYDLIPNLVETSKAYMTHERGTLEAVIQARNQALTATQSVGGDPSNANAMKALISAESALSASLGKLIALSENYPNLKADQTIARLMEELSATENKVSFSRQAYNDSVMSYNIQRESFPDVFIANAFHFDAAILFEIEKKEEREAVQVKF
jgi:LemA protein